MSLFYFDYFFDDGSDKPIAIFKASSRDKVLQYILDQMQEYITWEKIHPDEWYWKADPEDVRRGGKYFSVFDSADWHVYKEGKCSKLYGGLELQQRDYRRMERGEESSEVDTSKTREQRRKDFLLQATTKDLEKIINYSYVDGDSNCKIVLHEITEIIIL